MSLNRIFLLGRRLTLAAERTLSQIFIERVHLDSIYYSREPVSFRILYFWWLCSKTLFFLILKIVNYFYRKQLIFEYIFF